jgi:hypothetical protein
MTIPKNEVWLIRELAKHRCTLRAEARRLEQRRREVIAEANSLGNKCIAARFGYYEKTIQRMTKRMGYGRDG